MKMKNEDNMNKRRFHSYGPVDSEEHFSVPRNELIGKCCRQLIGNPEKCGHYFTIWAPRQTGKTWLMRQVRKEIEKLYSDRFIIGTMSMQGLIMKDDDADEIFFRHVPKLFRESFGMEPRKPENWEDWTDLFSADKGKFGRPLILFIDEFDSLPARIIDQTVTLFRDMYLKRESFVLHGLALIGVRAVLGVESQRGSPFNIQSSLHVPNFTEDEVRELFSQYQEESGQRTDSEVVTKLYECTRGQPGLVCWFGELLTEKYNPGKDCPVDMPLWNRVYHRAMNIEWNNTVLNLVKKAGQEYLPYILEVFGNPEIPFSLRSEWCGYLYMNGIIDHTEIVNKEGLTKEVCRFSSPFIQDCLYEALVNNLIGDRLPILSLELLDRLSDVFESSELNLPALLERYKAYLRRLKAKGLNPWKDQPRRADLHLTEATGHFHLYFWLQNAVGRRCVISPEFPTGNGRVDLHLKCSGKRGIVEVKSFRDLYELEDSREQAARYAAKLGLNCVTVAVFVPTDDENILNQLSGGTDIDGVRVTVSAISWV